MEWHRCRADGGRGAGELKGGVLREGPATGLLCGGMGVGEMLPPSPPTPSVLRKLAPRV
jgi:hypothetical protein